MTVELTRSTDHVQTLVEPAIRALLDRLDPHNRLVAGYQLGFWDADGAPATARGKGLRPALALLGARAAGVGPEQGVPAAAAVELAHNFSLLHDDVMDRDTERRHRPTAWTVFGVGPAILAGDALIGLAYEAVAETPLGGPAAHRLSQDVRRLMSGQSADLDFERRTDVTIEECLRMAADKTAALLSCACALGAIVAGAAPALTAGLSRFGTHLGLAFQLIDDLLGIWGDPARTGKPVGSDLRARKKSLPLVWAATAGSASGQAFAELYHSARPLTEDEIALAARLVEATGARDWTERRARDRAEAALAELPGLSLPADVHRDLADLAAFVTGRDY
jgi:geranylgeranyl diphosphate synthase type I